MWSPAQAIVPVSPEAYRARLTDSAPVGLMVTAIHTDVTVGPNGLVKACSWCCSRAQLAELDRLYKGQVTHGLCHICAAKLDAETV